MDRDNIQALFPLSGVQQAALIHGLQGDGPDTGAIQVRFRIDGAVDDPTMDEAWQNVLTRHDGLRATIQIPKTQKPMVVIAKSAVMAVDYHDLQGLSDAEQQQKTAAIIEADALRPLPLNLEPVSRLSVLRLGERKRDYVWTAHKILLDGYSAILVLRDVMAFYEALREGDTGQMTTAPRLRSYYSHLKEQDESAAERYWGEYFVGYRPRPPVFRNQANGKSNEILLNLPAGLWPKLETTAASLAVTPAAIVAAAWSVFLSAAGAGDDVGFALSLSGRPYDLPGHDMLVGAFATTAPRRVRLRAEDSFASVARELHRDALRSQSHELLAPHLMFGGAQATRHVPMPDTLLTIETLPEADISLETGGGVDLSGFSSDVSSSFPIALVVLPGLAAEIKCITTDLANPVLAGRILPEFPELLAMVSSDPQISISQVRASYQHLQNQDDNSQIQIQSVMSEPETPVELAVAEIWKDVLGIDMVDMSRDFVSHGGRSFAAMRVLTRIEEAFGKRIPMGDFILAQTVPALAEIITRELGQGPDWQTLVPFRIKGKKRPILFVHLGQHPVSFLSPLVDRLGADQPFFAVQPVGVVGEAKPLTQFEILARIHVEEYLSVATVGPVDVIGNCGGARLAVEVSRQLEERGCDVVNFLAIDTRPPDLRYSRADAPLDTAKAAVSKPRITPARIARALSRRFRWGLLIGWGVVSRNKELRRLVKGELIERACYIADMSYRADRFPKRVVVIRSTGAPIRTSHWTAVSDQVEVLDLKVGHFTLFFEPEVDILSAEIQRVLSDTA